MWGGNGWVDWTELVLQSDFEQEEDIQVFSSCGYSNSLASPCSDDNSLYSTSTATEQQSLVDEISTPALPHLIDVGLHPAALAPPGFYRKMYYKPKAGPSLCPIQSPSALPRLSTSQTMGAQLPLTIPHAAGELLHRPIKRRHPVDLLEEAKRLKLDTDLWQQLHIPLNVEEAAIKCSVRWNTSNLLAVILHKQEIEVRNGEDVVVKETLEADASSFCFKTEPGKRYSVKLSLHSDKGNILARGEVECKAVFSLEEMDLLMCRALTCTGTWMQSFTHLYRCKPKIYFDDIYFRRNGVIEKYKKDNNGQAASPINSEIYGLFFSARTLLNGTMAPNSCYGDMRLTLPAQKLLDPNRISLYFCDFYCNRLAHYVTVVICENGSESDEYCKERLIPLDWESNSFLRILPNDDPNIPFLYYINKCTWIEIYYTENVLMDWGTFHSVNSTGPGSVVGGLPHNKACTMCNLYPVKSKLKNQIEEAR